MTKLKKHANTTILVMIVLLGLFVVLTSISSVSAASTVYVNATGGSDGNFGTIDSPYQTISKGISSVEENGTVQLADGNYSGAGNTGLTISRNMTITGQSQKKTIINGTDTNWIFTINSGATVNIQNLTLTNGRSEDGGAIYNYGTCNLILTDCTLTHNYAGRGGAIYNIGNLTAINCIFTDNTVSNAGGAILNGGTAISLKNCTLTRNQATNGGAISNWAPCNLTGCTLTDNTATGYGGAIFLNSENHDSTIFANFNRFYNNTATYGGNAICTVKGHVNANYNWWGSNDPAFDSLLYLLAYNDPSLIYHKYWLFMTVNAAPSTIYKGQSSQIEINFNNAYDGTTVTSLNPANGHIPDETPVILSLTSGPFGSFNGLTSPVTLFTGGGLASISFNATSAGIQDSNTATDDEKVSASVTINELASIGDLVWNDIDKDGIQDAGEPGIAGVTVNLYNSTSEIIATTTTDANGHYLFNNIIPGTYSVGFMLPYGYKFSSQNQGADDTKDSDADTNTGRTTTKILLSGENDVTWDAGIYWIVPVANPDNKSVDEDNSITDSVADNDTPSMGLNTWILVSGPAHGTLDFNSNGSFTYTPDPNYHGPDRFTYYIQDSNGATSATVTASLTINPVNDAPVANDDSKTINEDHTATGQITATDADSDTLTYTKDTNPAHGTATVNSDGTWTYTPNMNYYGTDSFTILVSDGNGETATATVTIIINSINDAPKTQNDSVTTKEGKSINIIVLGNDSDIDGDSLTVTNVTQPNHGTATINTDGTVTYTPNSNWYGTDSFTYTVSDGNGRTATATVNITVSQAVSDLYIKTTTSNQNPTTGDTFKITYKLGNYGPDTAENVTITFQIPEGLDFVNISVDRGKYSYNETTRTVTWTLDSVPVGDPYLYLTAQAADDGTYKITPSIISDTYNLNSGDSGAITFNVQPNNNSNNENSNNENTVNAASKTTIGLQDTGLPLNYLLLAVLMVLSGLVPKRK